MGPELFGRYRPWWLIILVLALASWWVLKESDRPASAAGQVTLAVDPSLEQVAHGLVQRFQAAHPRTGVAVKPVAPALLPLFLRSGRADLALTRENEQVAGSEASRTFPRAILFYDPLVLAAPVFSSLEGLTSRQAEEFLAGKGPANDEIKIMRLTELHPGLRPLPVDGIPPTLDNIASGRYRPARPVVLWERPARIWRPQFNRAAGQLATWLKSAEAAEAFYGTRTATLAVVGDIMLARGVARKIREQGLEYPLARTAARLQRADFAFANLESPFGLKGRPIPDKLIWFRADPSYVAALTGAGIDAVTLANNHILDYDTENFLETLEILERNGILYTGGGRTLGEARRPLLAEVKGIRVAFLGYSQFADLFWSWKYRRSFAATGTLPGVAPMREDYIIEDIRQARSVADIVVVAFHWGEEYQNYPTAAQVALGHRAVETGADIVLGFHPHAIQGIEFYRQGVIAYSLGNFVMDQKRDITRESMILEFLLSPRGVLGVEIVPAMIDEGQPRILEGEERLQLLSKFRSLSSIAKEDFGKKSRIITNN